MNEDRTRQPSPSLAYSELQTYIQQAEERLLFRILPNQVAEALSRPRRLVLERLVEGIFRGDTILHWEIRCPVCGRWGERPDWLRHAQHEHTCQACQSIFTVHLDEDAQVSFSPHPNFRSLRPEADDTEFQRSLRSKYAPTTVQDLMTIQAFRDWAREEPLPGGEYLEVRRMALWFSDLTGSTALYARSGDPMAYHLVREHFEFVFAAVQRAEGAVIKTIGDGVMAVFSASKNALQAAINAHEAMVGFNRGHDLSEEDRLSLKVGIHCGPAIMVMLNDRLDYFGTTVNEASRISGLAQGNETLLSAEVYTEPGVQALLADYTVDNLQAELRGLSGTRTVYRVPFERKR